MSTWIKMRVDLADDPSVVQIAAMLGVDEDLVVGKLHRLWAWADRQTTDGKAAGITGAWIDRYVYQPGFAEAMVAAGWLKITDSGVSFPNFDRHNGDSTKKRMEAAERKRLSREKCDTVTKMSQPECDTVTKKCDQRREEKNREEKKETPTTPQGGPDGFEEFWQAFPRRRRVDKGECWKIWRTKNLDAQAASVMAGLESWKRSKDWTKDGGDFTPEPAKWLRRDRWLNPPEGAGTVAKTTIVKASDHDQAWFKAWWRGLGATEREAWAKERNLTAGIVDQEINQLRVRAEWVGGAA